MKLFHLSDLHIGLNLCGRDMIEDQEYVLNQIIQAVKTENPDAVLIAGDIYDRSVPSAEAVSLCNRFLENLVDALNGHPVMIISGNHDNCDRIDYLSGIVRKNGIYMVGNPPRFEDEFIEKVTLNDEHGEVNFYLLPFVKPSMVKNITGVDSEGRNHTYDETVKLLLERENIDSSERNVIVSHQFYCPMNTKAEDFRRTDSEITVVGNIDAVSADYLKPFDYAALGHIHTPMSVGEDKIRYCGTPIACSVSEEGQKKGIVVVNLGEKGSAPEITTIPLVPKHEIRKIADTLENLLSQPSDDYVSIVITDKNDGIAQFNRDKIKVAFPNYLDIGVKRETASAAVSDSVNLAQMNEFDFCKAFAGGTLSDEDEQIILDIINRVGGMI